MSRSRAAIPSTAARPPGLDGRRSQGRAGDRERQPPNERLSGMTRFISPLALLALLAGSCAGMGDGPIDHPTGADEVILRVESGSVGLMHPMEVMNPGSPMLTLYGDGRLIVDEAEERSRFVTTFTVARLTEAGIQRLLDEAHEAGLRGEDRQLYAGAGDEGDATISVTLVSSGATHVTSAWNLDGTGEEEEGLDGETLQGREALRGFLARLEDLVGLVGEEVRSGPEPFEPGRWAVVWAAVRDPEQDGPWPSELVAEFRVRPWPLAPLARWGEPLANVPTIRCTLVEGEDAEQLSSDLADDTFWESEGVVYHVYARPLLPDEDRCSDVA
jgi:hypothetical protein